MLPARSTALIALLLAAAAHAAEGDPPLRRIPKVEGPVIHEVRSTPYPGGALYLSRGISGAFMGGKVRNQGEDRSVFQWQGEIAYFYNTWMSAGAGFLITAGEPDADVAEVRNRYFLHARFHKTWSKIALYAGPKLGLDNLNVLKGTDSSSIRQPIRSTQPDLGLEIGGGWKFSRWVGMTFGSGANYSFVNKEGAFLNNELKLRVIPGLAVDVLAFTDTMRELVPALYIALEYQSGFLLFESGARRNDQAVIAGVCLAF